MPRHITFEDALRAVLAIGAVAAVIFLAVVIRDPNAGGVLFALVGLAGSWLFRGKVAVEPTANAIATVRSRLRRRSIPVALPPVASPPGAVPPGGPLTSR